MKSNRNRSVKLSVSLVLLILIGVSFTTFQKYNPGPKVEKLKLLPNFKAEHLYSPSASKTGSWVSMAFDDKGRIITSDQYGFLYRLEIPPIGSDTTKVKVKVEKLIVGDSTVSKVGMGYAHGLLYAFNSLYVMVNHNSDDKFKSGSGLYRLQDTDGDDQFDKVTLLKSLTGEGEHGPHSIVLSPDKKSIYMLAGNYTDLPEMDNYRLPKTWQEDNALATLKDPNGHATDRFAPGAFVMKTDPEGKKWELISGGYRNPFDFAFNEDGEMFVYDGDMEWDFGMPWYKPTRISHSTSGSEFGWRSGNTNWSPSYVDNLPAILNIGQGSPTNLVSSYNARFPEKYRRGLLAFDWTFGIVYSVQLIPDGSSYKTVAEEFLSGQPLPLTDGLIGPDGALYFLTGGRGLESDLYRVYYGDNSLPKDPLASNSSAGNIEARNLRKQLEEFQGAPNPDALKLAWPNLKNKDRFIRYAARIAVEHQPIAEWKDKALNEKDPITLIQATVALARNGGKELNSKMLNNLMGINYLSLNEAQKMDLLRTIELTVLRTGKPQPADRVKLSKYLNAQFPAKSNEINRFMTKILVYIGDEQVVSKTMAIIDAAKDETLDQKEFTSSSDLILKNPQYGLDIAKMLAKTPPAQQIYYAVALSEAKKGWTPALRTKYFKWFYKAFGYKGGNSYIGFIDDARKKALANVPKEQFANYNKLSGDGLVDNKQLKLVDIVQPKGPGKDWKLDDALAVVKDSLIGRNYANGKMMFAATLCSSCHATGGEGGSVGPDLTRLGTRFSEKDILESIISPSKVISDQYAAKIYNLKDGSSIVGRFMKETKDKIYVSQNPFSPQTLREIKKSDIVKTSVSELSVMMPGMINSLNKEELKDLMAYLISGGNKDNKMFQSTSK
ncbi:c-type cytochrome [Pedobacter foliorum]|uniref:c-type cytochrome n=1 Tax=Pedobacter foliorum TaxID=2739058 RepID=UPI0015635544|nr:c-type cytochrome [Pedobacter foliorum]NRF38021.1 c-type cytochrome [Pedobacter foliorum]